MSTKKFEKMIESIVNDDEAKAKALFHEIIVEKSRQIYESMMAEDQSMGLLDEIESEENGGHEMMEDEFETDEEISGDYDVEGDDEEFDMDAEEDDMEDDEFDMEDEEVDMEDGEGELEDRVVDLEDKLDQLMADFEAQMGDEEFDDEEADMDMDDEEMDAEEDEDELMENVKMTKVRGLYDAKIGGDDGADKKSPYPANSGERNMEGTPVNYDAGAEESQKNGPVKANSYVTKGQTQVQGAKSFKNLPGKSNFSEKGEAAPKPKKASTSGMNTSSTVPTKGQTAMATESKRTIKKRI